jgi:hypothetical protein
VAERVLADVVEAAAEADGRGRACPQRRDQLALQLRDPGVAERLDRAHDRRVARAEPLCDLRGREERRLLAVVGVEVGDRALLRTERT